MVIKEFFSVPILSVVAGSSVAFRSPVVERLHCIHVNLVTNFFFSFFLSNGTAQKMFIKEVQGVWKEANGLCTQ